MLEPLESKYNKNKTSSLIEPVDPNLNLPSQPLNVDDINNIKLSLRENIDNSNIKKQLSLELLKQIIENPNNSEEEKEKYNNIRETIIKKKYFYIYDDINLNIPQIIEENEQIIESPILLDIPNSLDYDVELYKIGKKCKGSKKRHAIIKRGGFFSSNKSINNIDEKEKKKLKDKTQFLNSSELFRETLENFQKNQGEWHDKKMNYRIRINYPINQKDKKPEMSSFFLYFDDENKMNEVYIMLFGICLTEDKKQIMLKNINDLNNELIKRNKFYTIMKILAVKNRIKKRKMVFNKIEKATKGKIYGELLINKELVNKLSDQRKNSKKIQISNIEPSKNNSEDSLRFKAPKKINQFQKQYSDFMPLISNISPSCNNKFFENKKSQVEDNRKSLQNLISKYESLKYDIPNEIINENNIELNEEGICFNIPNGVEIIKNDEINDFKLEPQLCNNAKFIYFDRNKPEIKFKVENNNYLESNHNEDEVKDRNVDIDILSDKNIYEISNIVLNSNIDMNEQEENNLIILGPKSNNNKGISYQNKINNIKYLDPEDKNIKEKTYNIYNKEEINGTTIQIIQSKIDINKNKINTLIQNIRESYNPEINDENLKDNLLFGYTIKISDLKSIESIYVFPKDYKNNICFIEYNHQYFIPSEYKNSDLIIECFCIPVISYNDKIENIPEEKKGYIGKLLSPFKIGYVKINYEDIDKGKFEYPIKNNDIPEPNSFFIIEGGPDSVNTIKLKNIQGKDYSIGSDSYIETIINKDFIDNAKINSNISDEIKDKYFNISFEENDFLFRPNENMEEEEFYNEISTYISNDELEKIKNNKKFNFLPYCEKYEDENTLLNSQNLKCLSEEQKTNIINNFKPGQWIYKIPEIKAKLLSKNIGATDKEIYQFLYCKEEPKSFLIEDLNNDNNNNKVIPINENNFNIFDKKEINNMENFDNFQWKTGIKFNNELQITNAFLFKITYFSKAKYKYKRKK